MVADSYEYSNRGFKGSKDTRSKSTTFQDFNYEGTKSLTSSTKASNQILPYQKGRNIDKLDLSKALAFALKNAGKSTRGNPSENTSIISFFHELGKRSLGHGTSNIQQPCSSSQKHPMVHVHIKELSKGAKKLNHIIKTCSNGLNFRKGKYSITCGEDLIEGAIELEQSLQLLVDIQKASSEYITTKPRRNQIKLLEENDEEEEDDLNHNYGKIKKVAKADIQMRLLAVNYPEDQGRYRIEKGETLGLAPKFKS